jgi:mono/diheme cytochrome c family protein
MRRLRLAALTPAIALVVASGACEGRPAPIVAFDPGPVPAEHAAGERRFNARCAGCHGLLAAGTRRGPPLVHAYYEPGHHADEAFRRAVALGVVQHHWSFGPMPKVEDLTPADVERIIAYVRWLQQRAGIT